MIKILLAPILFFVAVAVYAGADPLPSDLNPRVSHLFVSKGDLIVNLVYDTGSEEWLVLENSDAESQISLAHYSKPVSITVDQRECEAPHRSVQAFKSIPELKDSYIKEYCYDRSVWTHSSAYCSEGFNIHSNLYKYDILTSKILTISDPFACESVSNMIQVDDILWIGLFYPGELGSGPGSIVKLNTRTNQLEGVNGSSGYHSSFAVDYDNNWLWSADSEKICAYKFDDTEKKCFYFNLLVNKDHYVWRLGNDPPDRNSWVYLCTIQYGKQNYLEYMRAHIEAFKKGNLVKDSHVPCIIPDGLESEKLEDKKHQSSYPMNRGHNTVINVAYIAGSEVNMRAMPFVDGKKVNSLRIGTEVNIIFETGGWVFVDALNRPDAEYKPFNGSGGFVKKEFVSSKKPILSHLIKSYYSAVDLKEKRKWAERAFLLAPYDVKAFDIFIEVLRLEGNRHAIEAAENMYKRSKNDGMRGVAH